MLKPQIPDELTVRDAAEKQQEPAVEEKRWRRAA
jgi:hypothetical protein